MSEMLKIERVFDAPRELVWKAFTDPDEIAQWFGPVGYSVPRESVKFDLRVGGSQSFTMVPDDPSWPEAGENTGTITELVEGELLVTGEDLDPEMAAVFGADRIEMRLEFHDIPGHPGRTRLVLEQGPYGEIIGDAYVGWNSSFTKLDRLLGVTDGGRVLIVAKGDREIVIARTFRAPAQQVWDAITDPALIAQWWAGQRGAVKSVEHDVRVGGAWRNVMETPDGTEVAFRGEYIELEEPKRIVSTEVYEPFPDFPTTNTTTLIEDGQGATRLETHILAATPEARDMQLQSGMEIGVQEGYDLLEGLAQSAA